LQRWGRISKSLLDLQTRELEIHRYRCTDCARTFRSYPPGVGRVSRSRRIRKLAALIWALGLSLDHVVSVFQDLGIELSRTTVWRDGQTIAPFLRKTDRSREVNFLNPGSPRAQKLMQRDEIILILQVGYVHLALGIVDEDGPYSARRWLETLADEIGLEVTVTVSPPGRLN
jgi:hypothetical protein